MDRELKLEQGDWGAVVMSRDTWKYSDPSRWEMITDKKEKWWGSGSACKHPDSPLIENRDCSQNPNDIVCPYCGYEHGADHEDYNCDSDEFECYECEKTFILTASFGYGFSTEPKPCKHHHYVFAAQYFHNFTTWRTMACINCGESNIDTVPKKGWVNRNWVSLGGPAYTLLPWLDEYNDPDFFDPDGVLKTGADLNEGYETPILDFLDNGTWGKRWDSYHHTTPWLSRGAQRAIDQHEKVYGEIT